jgi:PEP-CTERM motif
MKSKLLLSSLLAGAALAMASAPASAGVVCNNCTYAGNPGSYIGTYNPNTNDNGTVGNATTGTNGNFDNYWVFDINPGGEASVNAIFLPTDNISNFDVKLYSVTNAPCSANTISAGGACSLVQTGALVGDGFTSPAYSSSINFTDLTAGRYAFEVTGTISGLTPNQPASYVGQIQVRNDVPEPASLALVALGLLGAGAASRKRKVVE